MVDLPTPPFPLPTKSTFVSEPSKAKGLCLIGLLLRSFALMESRSSALMVVMVTWTAS